MVLCPVALAVGCRKCPVFSVCPLKSTIGDYAPEAAPEAKPRKSAKAASAATGETRRRSTRRR